MGNISSPISEHETLGMGSEQDPKSMRKRSQPPSRHRADGVENDVDMRRQRSYPNLYNAERRDSKGGCQTKAANDRE